MKILLNKILKSIKVLFSKVFCGIEVKEEEIPQPYELVFYEKFVDNKLDESIWKLITAGPSSWNKYMGGTPEVLENNSDGKFIRFNCVKDNGTYLTSGIRTKIPYGDGKFECEARFHSGKASWPAIWMSHPNGGANNYETYYEVDISEYYETRNTTDTTYHSPESMRDSSKSSYMHTVTEIKKEDWNKFVCTWDEKNIIVYINGKEIFNLENDGNSLHYPITSENRTFDIILSMQYVLKYLSDPDESQLPLYMDMREIKYWKKNRKL